MIIQTLNVTMSCA